MRYLFSKKKDVKKEDTRTTEENLSIYESDGYSEDISDEVSVVSESSNGRSRAKFSERDLHIIREECKDVIRSLDPINSVDLERKFTTNKTLIPLYEKFGFSSLKIKMRTERNKVMRK